MLKYLFKNFLNFFGLTLEKDYSKADGMWVNALNHVACYLLDANTPEPVILNLIELLVRIDPDGEEFINEWLNDWKNKDGTEYYINRLNIICPLIINERNRIK